MNSQDPNLTEVMDSSERFSITILSRYRLTEDQLDTIVDVVETDIKKRYKPFDIGIDITVYTGFLYVSVVRNSNNIIITID